MSQNPQDIQLYPFDFTVLSGGPLAPYPQSYPLFPDCTMFDDWLDRPFRSVSPASSITDWNETHAAAAQRDPFARAGTFSYHEALPNFCTVEDLFVCGAGAGFEGTSDSFQDHHHYSNHQTRPYEVTQTPPRSFQYAHEGNILDIGYLDTHWDYHLSDLNAVEDVGMPLVVPPPCHQTAQQRQRESSTFGLHHSSVVARNGRRERNQAHIVVNDASISQIFNCPHCPKQLQRQNDLRRHKQEVHGLGPKPTRRFECADCHQKFKRNAHLVSHLNRARPCTDTRRSATPSQRH
ncbi:hypothetical protein BJ508DRAFT_375803 [Ascobolus immersus RN42]|uniref:C2H2-type domain-containing protein n=1 Tax=Ascobolus immersus RN42 TaxID=1160509 RepID=A0A3N4I8C3_ASCIM|nr:hypothetical protein BJ508DRAFT_375803 [Ascobolus immersus RN42]